MVAPTVEWVRPGVGFTPEAAASFRRLEAQVGRSIDVNSSYRDYNTQMGMYLAYRRWQQGLGPKPNHGYAAHPDSSDHCRAIAVDTDDWATLGRVLLENGWRRTDPNENWHWVYNRANDRYYGQPTGGGSGTVTPGDDMPLQPAEYAKIVADIFNTPVANAPNGVPITLAQFMNQTWMLQNDIYDDTPSRVWKATLEHPVVGGQTSAGDLLRYEPAEHAGTRAKIAELDPAKIDLDALASVIAEKLPQSGLTKADMSDAVREVLNNLTLRSVEQ